MIRLNQKYTGDISENGKPNTLTLHNETLDICAPDYKRGSETTVAYSDIKQIYASKNAIILKIMRTEVTLCGFSTEDRRDFVRFIEIGRREPLEKSKEYRKYLNDSEKKEQKQELKELKEKTKRKAKAARIAAIADTVDRFTVERAKNRQREAEMEFEKEKRLQEAEDHIGYLIVNYEDDFDSIKRKVSECYTLFNKYSNYSDEDYVPLSDKIHDVFKDNITFLEENYPEESITERARSLFNKIDKKYKMKSIKNIVEWIVIISLAIGSYFFLWKYTSFSDLIKFLK